MIKLFGVNDKSFSSNGDKIIKALKAKVHKEDNGSFYLDIETDLSYIDDITSGRIIVANTPQGEQAFRISNLNVTKHRIKAKCKHIYYDTETYLIADSYVVDKNCNDALDHLNNATDNTSPFSTISDILTINSYRCVRKSLNEAINTVLERWGGHLLRDNWNIGIRESIGQDNGVTIRYKKNLKEIECTYDWSNVVTKLLPVGKDETLLDELYVLSDIQYEIPYTKTISFSQDHISEDNYKDENGNLLEEEYVQALKSDLLIQATEYLRENSIPKVNYKLKANVEKISDVGDTIEVVDERIKVNILTNIISYDYDCISKEYTELEFGNFKKKLSNLSENIVSKATETVQETTEKIEISLQNELQDAQDRIYGVLGNSYVIDDGDKLLVVDKLPKETATNCILINNGGIAFSQTGINGTFNSAWTIDGTLNMQNINVINLVADMIKGGTLKLGSTLNQAGKLELYDEANRLISTFDKNGLIFYCEDNSYIKINPEVGFAGYDAQNNKIYWADGDEFHMKKSVVEEEITLANKLRTIPITVYDNDNNIINDGIGDVAMV